MSSHPFATLLQFWLLIIMRWQVSHIGRLAGKAVLLQHRAGKPLSSRRTSLQKAAKPLHYGPLCRLSLTLNPPNTAFWLRFVLTVMIYV